VRKKVDGNFCSCGQFLDNTRVPDEKIFINTFSIVGDKLQEELRSIITSPIDESDIEPFKMVKRLYQACMNESKSEFKF
jgi:membrane metallo-endopeptidase-like protein 1